MFSYLQSKGKAAGYKLRKMCRDGGLRIFFFFLHKLGSLIISVSIQVAHFWVVRGDAFYHARFLIRNFYANACGCLSQVPVARFQRWKGGKELGPGRRRPRALAR